MRLALELFRGVRAISEFDWSFAPTLSSSERFSTHISSDLHGVLPPLHPDQGSITRVRVCRTLLKFALVRTCFRYGFSAEQISLAT